MSRRDLYVDTSRVIDEVRLRRCLWDASDPLYKNLDARNKAWEDIANLLFENTTKENEKENVKIIQQRWRTARDAFFKTKAGMKNQPSGSAAKKRKYIYYEELMFLNPSTENDFDESMTSSPLVNVTSPGNAHSTGNIASPENVMSPAILSENIASPENVTSPAILSENIASPENVTSPAILSENIASPENTVIIENTQRGSSNPRSQNPWTQKRKYKQQQTNQESSPFEQQLLTLLSNQTPDIAADDLAFFSSLGPILRNFDIEQKLEFRSRMLREAMAIKNMRNSPSSFASTSRFSPRYDPYAAGTSLGYNYVYETPTGYQSTGYQSSDNNHNN